MLLSDQNIQFLHFNWNYLIQKYHIHIKEWFQIKNSWVFLQFIQVQHLLILFVITILMLSLLFYFFNILLFAMKYYPILQRLLKSFHLIFIFTFTNWPFLLYVFILTFIITTLCMLKFLEPSHLCYDLIHPLIHL